MNLRDKALDIANDAKEQVENGGIVLDTPDAMGYALILVLADISKQLEEINEAAQVARAHTQWEF